MTGILDKLAFGLIPERGCPECQASTADRCRGCVQALADLTTVNDAIAAVHDAPTEAEAKAAYDSCVLGLPEAVKGVHS